MCFLSQNINDCDFSVGGIQRLLFANYSGYVWDNLKFNEEKTIVLDIAIGLEWYQLDSKADVIEFKEGEIKSDQGTILEHSISWGIQQMESAKGLPVRALRKGGFIIIHQDNNGRYWIGGLYTPYKCSEFSAGTGASRGDNGYSFTFKSLAIDQIYAVSQIYIDQKVEGNINNAEYDFEQYSNQYNI